MHIKYLYHIKHTSKPNYQKQKDVKAMLKKHSSSS